MRRKDILNEKDNIEKFINDGISKQDICSYLNCKNNTLNKYLVLMGLEYSGIRKYEPPKKIEYYLRENITVSNTNHFKKRLINEGLKEHKCEKCERVEWEGNKIPIELHHIDGNRSNNLISNLQILCPNCHSLTDNYKSKNTVNKRNKYVLGNKNKEEYIKIRVRASKNKCSCGKEIDKRSKNCKKCYTNKKRNYCSCGNNIKRNSKQCKDCYYISQRRVIRPTYSNLIIEVDKNGYSATGRTYNVSDNTIRKWIKNPY